MTTEEKNKLIAEWLGYKTFVRSNLTRMKKGNMSACCDFLNDRNQQKLIEDKLIEDGHRIKYEYDQIDKKWWVNMREYDVFVQISKSKDTAFIDAVIELIQSNNE